MFAPEEIKAGLEKFQNDEWEPGKPCSFNLLKAENGEITVGQLKQVLAGLPDDMTITGWNIGQDLYDAGIKDGLRCIGRKIREVHVDGNFQLAFDLDM